MPFRVLLLAWIVWLMPYAQAASKPPNVILIVVDALGAKHMSPYGYFRDTSPFLGRFARENVLFENVSAQAAYTLTSTFSLFTGTYPYTHRIIAPPEFLKGAPPQLDPELKTITELFRGAGYLTRWVGLKDDPQMGVNQGIQRGFDLIHNGDIDSRYLREIFKSAGESKRNFFLFLHSNKVHDPYMPSAIHKDLFLTSPTRKLTLSKDGLVRKVKKRLKLKGEPDFIQIREEYMRQFNVHSVFDRNLLLSLYDSSIRTVDGHVKDLVDQLKKHGLYDNTIIAITADHGEAFWEHGRMFHSVPYRAEIHVPLILRVPGQSPKRIPDRAQSIDILPTLVELAGLPIPKHVEGLSLAPLLKGKKIPRDTNEHFFSQGHTTEAIWNRDWKLIAHTDGSVELFDLYLDPFEEHDIHKDHPKIVHELRAKLASHRLKRQKTGSGESL